jgi:hypothetical protein
MAQGGQYPLFKARRFVNAAERRDCCLRRGSGDPV